MFEIQQGRFGDNVPLSIIYDLAEELHIALDNEGYEEILQRRRVSNPLSSTLSPLKHHI